MHDFNIFTMCYGDHYIELFKRACFRSLNWPRNLNSIRGREWHVYTKREHFDQFVKIFEGMPFSLVLFPIEDKTPIPGCGLIDTSQIDSGVILLTGLKGEMANCLKAKKKMLLAPPDTIFGDGTVNNLINIGGSGKSCVAVAHPRVLPSILEEIDILGATRGAIENAQLVTLSFKHAHDSWKYAEIGNPKNTSFVGGIAWKQLDHGLYRVQHRLPTHYFVDFTINDWTFWWSQVSFGAYDHRWPAENIVRQQRQRYVGSSDACFIVEVTEWDKNVPQSYDHKQLADKSEDGYFGDGFHHIINRETSVIFRGE